MRTTISVMTPSSLTMQILYTENEKDSYDEVNRWNDNGIVLIVEIFKLSK